MTWHLVDESLPELFAWYICTVNDRDGFENLVEPLWFDSDGWQYEDFSQYSGNVIAWMPMPKPYRSNI